MSRKVLAALIFVCVAASAHAQTDRYEALANSPMVENRPTPETARLLKDELLFQRATQTYLWALPLINTLGMKVGSEKAFGAGYNILPVWKKRLDAKTLVTTPNSHVIYAMTSISARTARWCLRPRPACKAFCLISGSGQFRVQPSMAKPCWAMSAFSALTKARAANS